MKDLFELVYLVYSGKVKTQRVLSEAMFISLGKANTLFNYAVKEEYITKDYNVSDKGLNLLEEHKVDNAIIMAAGFGSRFVPMTFETPKGLLEVHGEIMIERQIRQLKEVGIHDITVVVGYMKEQFEYLSDKYDVKLIFNKDYATKNNISSLYYAKNELKNTYILTSDIYMKENIYREYEYNSFYAVEYFEGFTDEWAVTLNKDNLIKDINPSGGTDTWAMFGPTFFTKDFSDKMIQYIDDIYNDKSKAQWYWEDVYKVNMDSLDLYARKYPTGSIEEFESLEELREYDPSYLQKSRSEILEIIMAVFEVELHDIVGFSTLKEGMTNDSFLFEVNGVRYVFRNPGIGTELLINRAQETAVYNLIHDLNISDEVIYINPKKGYKITKFIEDSRVIDINNVEEVKLSFEQLRKLHEANLEFEYEFDIEERIEFYLKLCKETDAILFKDFDDVYTNVQKVVDHLKEIERPKVLCHIDSVYANFLYANNKVTLLDWEYASMADPLIDIAMYVVFGGLQDEEINSVLDLYLKRKHTDEELLVVLSYVSLSGFLWSLWTQYKQASGEDFGTYGMEQYQYARKYSRLVLKEFGRNA